MKIFNTLLTLSCLSGLVSCYPVAGQNTAANSNTRNSVITNTLPSEVVNTNEAIQAAIEKEQNETVPFTDLNNPSNVIEKEIPTEVQPIDPQIIKTASRVPGKEGFVFNPYTHNQVDVRHVPSGSVVRDPNDSNPAHKFKVP